MTPRRTAFDPQGQGFAFANTWHLDEAERQYLGQDFTRYFLQRGTLGPLGPLVVPRVVRLVRGIVERHLGSTYGLCGGMVFAALDFHHAGLPLPRGQHAYDQPAPGTPLRRFIWRRQMDTLLQDALRFIAWTALLTRVPQRRPFDSGPSRLLARSRPQWRKLIAALDAGQPVPLGLVRDARNVFENHQVLAVGYEQLHERHATLFLYDPNCPDRESTIALEFGEQQLDGRESCPAQAPPLRGFFCEAYTPADPREATQ